MRSIRCAVVASIVAATAGLAPATVPTQREMAVDFLRKNVVGRTLASPQTTFRIDGGKVEVVNEEQLTIGGFVETPEGFAFDLTSVSKATGYDIGADGQRTGTGRDWGGVRTYRYEIKEMRCSAALAGFARMISTTAKGKDPTGQFTSLRMKVNDGKLIVEEGTVDYVDFIATKGMFKPGAFDLVSRFSMVDGKLRLEQDMTLYDVDPATLKRTPAADKMATDVFKEVVAGR